jgi:hypothetical protein
MNDSQLPLYGCFKNEYIIIFSLSFRKILIISNPKLNPVNPLNPLRALKFN